MSPGGPAAQDLRQERRRKGLPAERGLAGLFLLQHCRVRMGLKASQLKPVSPNKVAHASLVCSADDSGSSRQHWECQVRGFVVEELARQSQGQCWWHAPTSLFHRLPYVALLRLLATVLSMQQGGTSDNRRPPLETVQLRAVALTPKPLKLNPKIWPLCPAAARPQSRLQLHGSIRLVTCQGSVFGACWQAAACGDSGLNPKPSILNPQPCRNLPQGMLP